MGVANKVLRCGDGVLVNNIAANILHEQNQSLRNHHHNHQHYWTYLPLRQRQAVPWTYLLFAVGLISLFTASQLESATVLCFLLHHEIAADPVSKQ